MRWRCGFDSDDAGGANPRRVKLNGLFWGRAAPVPDGDRVHPRSGVPLIPIPPTSPWRFQAMRKESGL